MTDRTPGPGVRALQLGVSLGVVAIWVIVIVRVSDCIGDAECTFAPRAIENAILAFVAGPLAVLAVWVVPVLARRNPGWTAAVWMATGSVGVAVLVAGVLLAGSGGAVAVVLLATGPALLLAGVAGLAVAPARPGSSGHST